MNPARLEARRPKEYSLNALKEDRHAEDHRGNAGLAGRVIEGPNEDLDWVDSWEDAFDIIGNVDAFILGAGCIRDTSRSWQAVLDNPRRILPFTGRPATEGEIEYAEFAGRTPHVVVSTMLQNVSWKHTRIVRDPKTFA